MNKLLSLVSFAIVPVLMLLLPCTSDARLSDLIQQGMSWEYSDTLLWQPSGSYYGIARKVRVESIEEKNDSTIIITSETFSGTYHFGDPVNGSVDTIWRQTYALVADTIKNLGSNVMTVKSGTIIIGEFGGLLPTIFPGGIYNGNIDNFPFSISNANYAFNYQPPYLYASHKYCFHESIGLVYAGNWAYNVIDARSSTLTLLSYCDSSISAARIIQQLDSLLKTSVTHKNIIPKTLSIAPSRSYSYDLLGREIPATLPLCRIPVLSIELINRQATMRNSTLNGK
jgi:hypothetical protein